VDDPAAGHEAGPVLRRETEREQRVRRVAPERARHGRLVLRQLQEQQPDRGRERRVVEATVVHGDVRPVRRRAVLAEEVLDRLVGVANGPQRVAERRGCGTVGMGGPGVVDPRILPAPRDARRMR
jgi:hypothetical protein